MTEQGTITTMFNDIASHYDFLNHLLSFRFDILWRRKLSKTISKSHPSTILDVATGTADLALRMARDLPTAQLTGIDLSQVMLEAAQEKIDRQHLSNRIKLQQADAQQLPFANHSFDAITVAFGVRNFEDPDAGLAELHRVVKPGGTIGVLEFSMPTRFPIRPLYRGYVKYLLPLLGRIVSKHPTAYTYLPESIEAFQANYDITDLLEKQGFVGLTHRRLCGGIASIHLGKA